MTTARRRLGLMSWVMIHRSIDYELWAHMDFGISHESQDPQDESPCLQHESGSAFGRGISGRGVGYRNIDGAFRSV